MRVKQGGFTPIQNKLLCLITDECLKNGSVSISKAKMAEQLNCCIHTADKAVKILRNRGYIEVIEQYDDNNSRLANKYVLIKKKLALSFLKN